MSVTVFDNMAVLVVLAAVFGYLNHRVLKLPFAIGLTVSALMASLGVLALDAMLPGLGLGDAMRSAVDALDFPDLLMHGMLSFLLFAGALHTDLGRLMERMRAILSLATVGVVISAAIIGIVSYALLRWLGLPVALEWCLVFGVLISPTDPVAVLGIMKAAGSSKGHEIKIVGESLLNDGVAVVLFTVMVAVASGRGGEHGPWQLIGHALLYEVVGGLLLGLAAGYLVYLAMRSLDEPNLEIMISFALVMGVTLLCFQVHASAPLACVVAGLFIGNHGRRLAMSERTRDALDLVWSFVDEGLNALLFLLVGLEVVEAVRPDPKHLLAGALAVPVALAARFVSVSVPITLLSRFETFTRGAIRVLTWGGLKGGISVALALSLPPFEGRSLVLTMTYLVAIFSIVVQGLTVAPLIRSIAGDRTRA